MKFMEALLLLFFTMNDRTYSLSIQNAAQNNIMKYEIDNNFKLPNSPIYSRGWFKFSNFEKNSPVKPHQFIKNPAFSEQFKENSVVDLKATDGIGLINIPDEDYHFAILTENTINFLSSRNSKIAKTIEIIKLDEITPITSKKDFQGGIINHGDFLEGFCFQINSKTKEGKNIIWELCGNNQITKIQFMNSIVQLLQKKESDKNQKDQSKISTTNDSNISKGQTQSRINSVMKDLRKGISKETLEKIKRAKEPTWIAITPWGECSKTCGGGKSYLQRICIVPKNSKEHCEGERIIAKDCNLQPCEGNIAGFSGNYTSFNGSEFKTKDKNKNIKEISFVNDPIVKILPISKKPLRYERCVIKEGDLAIYINDGYLKGTKIPARVILNNSTLTVYSSDTYESIIVSHRLSGISGIREYSNEKTHTCFEVEEKSKKTILCTFISNSKNLQILAHEWQKDILDFIKNCADYYSHELDYKDMTKLNADTIKNTLDFYHTQETEETEKIILRTQQLALQALEKELKVENLIEKEEDERDKQLADEFEKKYEKIKNQKELINQALDQKKKQADIYANKQVVKKKIIQISEAVKRQVEKIREDLKSRLLAKKKDEARKRELIKRKIESLKKDISNDLIRASKKGNYEECDPERSEKQITIYCKVNYFSDSYKMTECIKNDNFCYMCCEAEYGELHLELRNNCYTKCNDFYFFKKKFVHTKILNTYIDITPYMTKMQTKEEFISKTDGNFNQFSNKNTNIGNNFKKSVNDQDVMTTKFLEKNLKISTANAEASRLRKNFINSKKKKIIEERNNDISNMIEEEKKKELLMKIKEDLNFD